MSKFDKLRNLVRALHASRSADVPVGTILIIAFIVIPIVILVILFKDELLKLFNTQADAVLKTGDQGAAPTR
jgi:Na+-driven multidrug efflux pump